jgi:hypothetical protein
VPQTGVHFTYNNKTTAVQTVALYIATCSDSQKIPQNITTCQFMFTVSSVQATDRGSSVGKATGYGLNGSGIESRWGRDFSNTSRPALGPTQPPVQWLPGLCRG